MTEKVEYRPHSIFAYIDSDCLISEDQNLAKFVKYLVAALYKTDLPDETIELPKCYDSEGKFMFQLVRN